MKRKLFSSMLSIFALLLLMGAAAVPEQPAALLAEEESVAFQTLALETEARSLNTQLTHVVLSAASSNAIGSIMSATGSGTHTEPGTPAAPQAPADEGVPAETTEPVGAVDYSLLIDGVPAPLELGKWVSNGTTYVSLSLMSQQLDAAAQIEWDGKTMTVTTPELFLTATAGNYYLEANGRYLYISETVQLTQDGQISIPLRTLAKAFGATVGYDGAAGVVTVTRGASAITQGDSFYDANDLYWLSRVIYRESGNQTLKGQMAVGNVILNRVASPTFPNSVEGVLAQKNQFTTYASGVLAATNPSQTSIIAAKLVLDGGVVEETKGALFFDSGVNSWASRNRPYIATLGAHTFYG